MLRLARTVSFPELLATPFRSGLVVCGIAAGVALITALTLVNRSIVDHFVQSVMAVKGDVQLQVVSPGGEVGVDENLAVDVASVPGVQLAAPVIDRTIPASTGDGAIRLLASDFTNRRIADAYHIEIATGLDAADVLAQSMSILVPASPSGGTQARTIAAVGANGVRNLTVVGTLVDNGVFGGTGQEFAVMDFMAAQELLGLEHIVDRIDIVPTPDADLSELSSRLLERVGVRYAVVTPFGRGEYFERSVAAFQATIHGFGLLGLVTAIFIVYSTVSISVTRRERIIGTLRALGLRRREIVAMLALEAGVLGILASVLGGAAGVLLARQLVGLIQTTMGMIFLSRFNADAPTIAASDFLMAASIGTTAAIVAAIYPALRASRLEPLEAMIDVKAGFQRGKLSLRVFLLSSLVLMLVVAISVVAEVHFRSLVLGNVASVAWFVAFILISVPAVAWLATSAGPLLERAFKLRGKIAAENLKRSAVRASVAVSALALSLATTITFAGLVHSFEDSAVTWVRQVLAGDLLVASTHSQGGWLEEPISSSIVSTLERLNGVASVDTFRLLPGQRMGRERIAVEGMSASYLTSDSLSDWFVHGDPEQALQAVRQGSAVLISESLATISGLTVGDKVEIDAPRGHLVLPIAGIVIDYTSDRGSVMIEQNVLSRFWGDDRVNRIRVHVEPDVRLADLKGEIVATLGDVANFKVLTASELVDYHVQLFEAAFSPARVLELLLIIVTCAGIIDAVVASIHDRRREFGLMRASGALVRDIEQTTMIEVGVIVAAGLSLGIIGGSISAWLWVRYHFTYLLGWVLQFYFPWVPAGRAVLLSAAVALLAAYIPVRFAARHSILESLQYE